MTLSVAGFAKAVQTLGIKMERALTLALKDAANEAHRDAKRNALRSPTAAQARAARKAKWVAKRGNAKGFASAQKAGKNRRNPNSHSRAAPGGLERSIEKKVVGIGLNQDVEIFIAANAEAGKYAHRMHDEKGKTWRNRGPGTRAKGPQADDKFIQRAVEKAAKGLEARILKTFARL